MKRNAMALCLALLVGVVLLFSGTLLVLYADHCCSGEDCVICPALMRSAQWILGLCAVGVLSGSVAKNASSKGRGLVESQGPVSWTLVCRKVKLLI